MAQSFYNNLPVNSDDKQHKHVKPRTARHLNSQVLAKVLSSQATKHQLLLKARKKER